MPRIVRTYIKTALLYLLAGVVVGALLFVDSLRENWGWLALLQPVYYHLLTVGWLTQLIFGVAWWMFPTRSRECPRGPEWVMWLVWALLNSGLVLRAFAEPMRMWTGAPALTGALHLSSLLQMLAGLAFAMQMWPRVKAPRHAPASEQT